MTPTARWFASTRKTCSCWLRCAPRCPCNRGGRGDKTTSISFVAPKVGYRQVLVTDRRTKRDFAYAMRYLVDELFPDATCIDVVLDNLNTHHYHSLVEFFGKPEAARIVSRLCFHFTPPHGSWLNMAEIEIGVMTNQCLKQRIPDEWSLRLKLLAWERASNAAQRQIHWPFTVDDARHVFAEYYPSDLTS
jgi:transposase